MVAQEPGASSERFGTRPWMKQIARQIRNCIILIPKEFGSWMDSVVAYIPGEIGIVIRRSYLSARLRHLGTSCRIGPGAIIYHQHNLIIGRNTCINAAMMNAAAGITIGEDCLIASGVKIWSINHRFVDPSIPIAKQGYEYGPVVIGNDVWLASNAVILPGVTIGMGAIVGAGAVVTGDVESMTIVAGVPARPIGRRAVSDDR